MVRMLRIESTLSTYPETQTTKTMSYFGLIFIAIWFNFSASVSTNELMARILYSIWFLWARKCRENSRHSVRENWTGRGQLRKDIRFGIYVYACVSVVLFILYLVLCTHRRLTIHVFRFYRVYSDSLQSCVLYFLSIHIKISWKPVS